MAERLSFIVSKRQLKYQRNETDTSQSGDVQGRWIYTVIGLQTARILEMQNRAHPPQLAVENANEYSKRRIPYCRIRGSGTAACERKRQIATDLTF
jgi:hypothetical protein